MHLPILHLIVQISLYWIRHYLLSLHDIYHNELHERIYEIYITYDRWISEPTYQIVEHDYHELHVNIVHEHDEHQQYTHEILLADTVKLHD